MTEDLDPVALLAGTGGRFWYRCEANHTSGALVSPVGRSCSALIHDDGTACLHPSPVTCADASPCGAEIYDWIIDFDAGLALAAALVEARAERDRLRAALELITAEDYDGAGNYARIAAAALDGEDSDG